MLESKKSLVYKGLKKKLLSNKYPPMFKLPKEIELAKEFNVSRITIRPALEKLEKEGLIIRRPSKGTFVKGSRPSNKFLIIHSKIDDYSNTSVYILQGIIQKTLEENITTISCEKDFIEGLSAEKFASFVNENGFSGIITIDRNFTGREPYLESLQNLSIPVVLPHAFPQDSKVTGFSVTRVDEQAARTKAIDYLTQKGHRRIASIFPKNAPSLRGFTLAEYRSMLTEHNADNDAQLIVNVPLAKIQVERIVRKLMAMPEPPSAIICYSDFFATYVYQALRQMHLRVPEDIAVMGTCGYPGAALLDPPLSTIDYQYHKQGRMCVELLLKESEEKNQGERIPETFIDSILVERKSTDSKAKKRSVAYVQKVQ